MSEIVPPTFVLMRPDSASRWISATHAGAAASNGSRDIGQRSRGRSHSVIMQNLSIVRFEFATKFGRAIASACSLVFACSLITVQGIPLQASPWQTAAPAPGGSAPQATQNSDGFAKPQLSSTFTDARTGQLYGRYIIYETVPVVAYQHQEVTEQQWVPEWVTEEKLMAQTNYIPVVTYQLQLQTERSMNPFAQPKQYWQYVPVVQYQPNFTQVKQPVTYQKYVQKEVKKSIPVLVSQSQPRPKFVDMPLQGNGTLAPGSSQIAGSASVQQPVPTRPLDYPMYPSSAIVAVPPAAYYPSPNATPGSATAGSALAAYPAYNPQFSGWSATNPYLLARQNTSSTPPRNVNNPAANGGMPPGSYYASAGTMPTNVTPTLAARPTFQWPQLMTRTGSIFQGGFLKSNPSTSSYGTASSGTAYLASNPLGMTNPMPMGGGSILPLNNSYNNTFNSAGNSGARFIPRADGSTLNGNAGGWSMVPVNNYRDPSQSGIPASVLR